MSNDENAVRAFIEACEACASACDECAAACLREDDVNMMAACIRTDLQCAEICRTTARFLAYRSEHVEDICRICITLCQACEEECRQHDHDHCQRCAEACRRCAESCQKWLV